MSLARIIEGWATTCISQLAHLYNLTKTIVPHTETLALVVILICKPLYGKHVVWKEGPASKFHGEYFKLVPTKEWRTN